MALVAGSVALLADSVDFLEDTSVNLWFAYLRRHSSRLAGVRAELEGGAGR